MSHPGISASLLHSICHVVHHINFGDSVDDSNVWRDGACSKLRVWLPEYGHGIIVSIYSLSFVFESHAMDVSLGEFLFDSVRTTLVEPCNLISSSWSVSFISFDYILFGGWGTPLFHLHVTGSTCKTLFLPSSQLQLSYQELSQWHHWMAWSSMVHCSYLNFDDLVRVLNFTVPTAYCG